MDKSDNFYLSKSLFMKGIQCHKSLYLHKYHPELRGESTEPQEAIFQTGYEVGDYARSLFPGGTEIVYEENNYNEQLKLTRSEIEKGTATIYEAAFSYDNIFIKADMLHRGKDGWELYEVKSSASIKDHYYDDISVQYYVIKGCGIPISKTFIVYVNKQYVRNGEIEPRKLFTITDVTADIEQKQGFVKDEIEKMRAMLSGKLPPIDIGEYCEDPYNCDFYGHCWKHIPQPSVFDLCGNIDRHKLYKKGIVAFKDIPISILNRNQKLQVECFLEQKTHIDKRGIKEFIDSLWYPLYFLDFETTAYVAIPMFDSTRPYQKVPFQYSLHWLEHKNAELMHSEYLAPAGIDPRRELIEKLLSDIPGDACVLAYHKQFESEILNNCREWFPEYAGRIDKILENLLDLKMPFEKRKYYHYQMNGSSSLKVVLPAVVPEMGYDNMDINDGLMASDAYVRMFYSDDRTEIEGIRKALIEYCGLDTLGMVKILERLRTFIR